MRPRTTPSALAASAETAVSEALRHVGARWRAAIEPNPGGVVTLPNGQASPFEVRAFSVVDEATAKRVAARPPRDRGLIVVGDLVGRGAQAAFEAAGIGWLDRRGHLRVVGPSLWIDRDVPAMPRGDASRARSAQLRGAASIGVAASHLISGADGAGVRELARTVHLSPAAVSRARATLHDAGLLDPGPDARRALFWALVDAWRPTWIGLAQDPRPSAHLVASGTRAAATLGAPIVSTRNYPVDLYTADPVELERIRARAGGATATAVARLALAPTPLVVATPAEPAAAVRRWPVTHPLFVALDLATDPARGGEALEQWDPPGWTRAW